jgi:hypothetical protein
VDNHLVNHLVNLTSLLVVQHNQIMEDSQQHMVVQETVILPHQAPAVLVATVPVPVELDSPLENQVNLHQEPAILVLEVLVVMVIAQEAVENHHLVNPLVAVHHNQILENSHQLMEAQETATPLHQAPVVLVAAVPAPVELDSPLENQVNLHQEPAILVLEVPVVMVIAQEAVENHHPINPLVQQAVDYHQHLVELETVISLEVPVVLEVERTVPAVDNQVTHNPVHLAWQAILARVRDTEPTVVALLEECEMEDRTPPEVTKHLHPHLANHLHLDIKAAQVLSQDSLLVTTPLLLGTKVKSKGNQPILAVHTTQAKALVAVV